METTKPVVGENIEPLIRAFNYILDHPEEYDQTQWYCGSTCCFIGRIQTQNNLQHFPTVENVAAFTNIPRHELQWLSQGNRTLVEIYDYILTKLAGKPCFKPITITDAARGGCIYNPENSTYYRRARRAFRGYTITPVHIPPQEKLS